MQQSFARFIPCAYTRTLLFAHLRCSRARGGHGGSSSRWSRLAGATKDTTAASSAPPSHRGRPELGCTAGAATQLGVGAFPAGPAGRLLPGPPGGPSGGRCARRYRRLETSRRWLVPAPAAAVAFWRPAVGVAPDRRGSNGAEPSTATFRGAARRDGARIAGAVAGDGDPFRDFEKRGGDAAPANFVASHCARS